MKRILLSILLSFPLVAHAGVFNPGGGSSGGTGGLASGEDFPSSPNLGDAFLILDDSATGACDSNAGGATTLCYWDGGAWIAVNMGTASPTLESVVTSGRTAGLSVSQATGVRVGSTAADEFLILFRDSTYGPTVTCEKAGVLHDCNRIFKLLNGRVFGLNNASDVRVWEVDHTGLLTTGLIDATSANVTLTVPEETWFDAAGCQAGVAGLIWNSASSNIPAAACDPDSTPNAYASFDADTDESFDFDMVLPVGFTGAIDFKFIWKAAATSGAVGWCAQLVRVPDGTTSGQSHAAQSSSNCVSDTAKGTTLQENLATITGVTCTSCAAGDRVKGRISRDANGGAVTDGMLGDAHLIKFGWVWRIAK